MLENQSVETIFGVPPVQDLLSNGLPVELQSLGLMTIEQLRRRDRELYQRHEDQLGGKWAALLCLYGRILLFTTDGLIAYPKFATKTGKLVGVKLRDLSSSRQLYYLCLQSLLCHVPAPADRSHLALFS